MSCGMIIITLQLTTLSKVSVVCLHYIVNELQHSYDERLYSKPALYSSSWYMRTSVLSTAMMKYSEAYFLYTIL